MALPLPKVVPDIGPGGGLITAMGGINALNNLLHQTRINKAKADYAPFTTQAEAASKLAYAHLMAPQFLAKLLQNPGAVANMGDPAARAALEKVVGAGMGGSTGQNFLNTMPNLGSHTKAPINVLGYLRDKFRGFLGRGQQPENPLANPPAQAHEPQIPVTPRNELAKNAAPVARPKDGVILEGEQWYNAKGEPVYAEEVRTPNGSQATVEITGGQPAPTYAENTGKYEGIVKQGEESGKIRATGVGEIGEEMKQLSTTGANVDRLIDGFTNPDFVAMREEFPFLQDTQLKLAAHAGNPEQRNMIGTLIADLESFKGSTVNGFKGQTLKREFDYADKLKPTENDTVYTALGKLQTLKALKEIAWKKNLIIKNYMQKDKMSLADAVERADKQVDIKGVDKAVKEYTQPLYKLRNPKTGQIIMVPKKRMELLLTKGANNV